MNETKNSPQFIYRQNIATDEEYVRWLGEVKQRFRNTQLKAAAHVNNEMLRFYWSVGRDIVRLNAEQTWGKGIVEQISRDLRKAFAETKGFSARNIWYAKKWYLFYEGDHEFLQQPVAEIRMPDKFAFVPWGHHIAIITKCKTVKEAKFYIDHIVSENWSRSRLEDELKKGLYQRQGNAITNFSDRLPLPQGQLAQEILKNPYNFDFLTMREEFDERELEDALVSNITRFLLELGKGFAFVGRQMELQMPDGTSYFPDLVFYHIRLKAYVVIELKAVAFKPEFTGKLNFYVSAADELLRGYGDNPSIGLVICKSADETTVEWSMRGVERPLGVAAYQLKDIVNRTVAELECKNTKRSNSPKKKL